MDVIAVSLRGLLASAALVACKNPTAPRPPARDAAVPRDVPTADVRPADAPSADAACDPSARGPLPASARVSDHRDVAGPHPAVRSLHLTFVGDPSRSVTVQWGTDEATLASEVRYRWEGDLVERVARGFSFTYAGSAGRRQHRVHLCDLGPGRRYTYDAGGSSARSPRASFVTAPDGALPVRVLVTGDSRRHPAVWRVVAERAMRERPDVMIFTGDAVDDGSRPWMWEAFFAAAPEFLASTPAYWIDGNHEGVNTVYDAQFAFTPNGTTEYHGRWWASTYGPLRLIGLNDVTLPPRGVILRDETRFLERELAVVDRRRTPWVVTAHHAPMHSTSDAHRPDPDVRRAWGALYDRYRVDLDLAGHTHNYQSSRPMLHDETLDPRGTRYVTFGGAGASLYRFRGTAPWVLRQEVTHGYAILTVDARRARWEARRLDGSLLEAFESQPLVVGQFAD